jgi:dihydroorotate dehydrogenase (fumarate)
MNLQTTYLGLTLANPLVASASPLNADLDNIKALEDAGAGAVVLPSIFAEQIEAEAARHEALVGVGASSSPEANGYFPTPDFYKVGPERYLELVRSARSAVSIPIIASLNAASDSDWEDYATQIQDAGASALELNIYFVPADISLSGRDVEQRYLDIIRAVKSRATIPLAVKVSPYFSSPGHMALEMVAAGADGLVLFNRFYQPDIDLVRLAISTDLELSRPSEMRLPLMWLAILHGRTKASLAATTGVHTADDVVKYLLAGADVVMTTSAILEHGTGHMRTLLDGLTDWLDRREMADLAHVRGLLSQGKIRNPEAYERANYIKVLQSYHAPRH